MLIGTICSRILKDNQAAFNVNYIRPNTTKISGLILLLVVCCLQVSFRNVFGSNNIISYREVTFFLRKARMCN